MIFMCLFDVPTDIDRDLYAPMQNVIRVADHSMMIVE